MRGWFTELSSTERLTFWACFWGWALDAMDVQLYAVAMSTLIALWSLTKSQAGLLSTTALIVSAIGGWLAGVLADKIGRTRVLQITILWYSIFTALSGFTNSFGQLMAVRSLQGLGFGGEWATGAVLMSEVIRKRYRGRAVGTVQSGWAVGYGIAALLFSILFSTLPSDLAWRVLFWVGILPAFVVIFIRRNIEEPALFTNAKKKQAAGGKRSRASDIFRVPLIRRTAVASLLAAAALGGNYAILTWLPTYLSTVRHLSALGAGGYLAVNIFGSFCGYLTAAHLSDYLGRRNTFVLFATCAAVVAATYMFMSLGASLVLLLGFPLGFCQSGIIGGMGATFSELFPTNVRATGQGFSYNFGRGLGSLAPALVGLATVKIPLATAIGGCAVICYAFVIGASLLLPETKSMELARLE